MGRSLKAVTLPEVMLALALLAIVIISLATLFGRGLQLQRKSTLLLQATQAAQRELEAIRDLPAERLPAAATTFDGRAPDPADADFPPLPYPGEPTLPLKVHIEPHLTDMRWVTVEVFYDGRSLTLEALLKP